MGIIILVIVVLVAIKSFRILMAIGRSMEEYDRENKR